MTDPNGQRVREWVQHQPFSLRSEPKPTFLGIAILVAAAVIMPWLAKEKRRLSGATLRGHPKPAISNNVGAVKYFFRTLLRALGEDRHFALDEIAVAITKARV
ncbi:MAG TPA: hypothetical protein VMU26_19905 [Candidatus Polarisedimenticolia bacterium]|nr:hypothetical protein [Candidatus Polarisedimenticolia bacterium]